MVTHVGVPPSGATAVLSFARRASLCFLMSTMLLKMYLAPSSCARTWAAEVRFLYGTAGRARLRTRTCPAHRALQGRATKHTKSQSIVHVLQGSVRARVRVCVCACTRVCVPWLAGRRVDVVPCNGCNDALELPAIE